MLKPIILATQEAGIRRIYLGKEFYLENTQHKLTAQAVKSACLASMKPSSNPSAAEKKKVNTTN
jgi:hypothetical protein